MSTNSRRPSHDPRRAHPTWTTSRATVAGGPTPAEPAIDYAVVNQLRLTVSDRLHQLLHGREPSAAERRGTTIDVTRQLVREHADNLVTAGERLPAGYERAMAEAVIAALLGLGRLQPLLDNPAVENIMVMGHDRVRVEYGDGRVDTTFRAADSDTELVEVLRRAASRYGLTERTLSTSNPVLHLRLPDGSRLAACYLITPRPVVVIRRHRIRRVSLDDLVVAGCMSPDLAAFLAAAVRGYLNIMIAGVPNAGKSTLLRAIASVIPADEWFATMETERELGLDETGTHPWTVPFEERQGHGERQRDGRLEGEISLADLFPHTLRMSMTRIIVGEVRSAEVVSMFDAGDTTQGILSTIHARHPHAVFDRLAGLLMRHGASRNREGAYIQVAGAIDLVVFVAFERPPGQAPRRYVSHVVEVNGLGEHGGVAHSDLFAPRVPGGLAEPTGVRPAGRVADALRSGGLDPLNLAPAAEPASWGRREPAR